MKIRSKRVLRLASGAIATMAVVGCNAGNTPGPDVVTAQASLCNPNDSALAATRGYDANAVNFAMANGYYGWCVPEYDDDQRLSGGPGNGYGPVAHVLARPKLELLPLSGSFEQVAIVYVDVGSDPLPPTYSALRLGQYNCVYLRQSSSSPLGFDARIDPPVDGNKCPSTMPLVVGPPGSMPPLVVSVDIPYSDRSEDYPPVTRFIEGLANQTLIGIRCGNRWCAIGAPSATSGSEPHSGGPLEPSAHSNKPVLLADAQGRVKGWFDDQLLGVPDAAPPHKLHREARASAIPDPRLGELTIANFESGGPTDYKTVGRVYFPAPPNPNSKYVKVFGFAQGINTVGLRAVPGPANTTVWYARVITENNDTTARIATNRMDHRTYFAAVYGERATIPATLRWRWLDDDEDLWVACDMGCCLVGRGS